MYTLFYYPGNASLLPHMMLREIGAPFELSLVDRANSQQTGPDYLRLNPTGKIPVLLDDGTAIYETAAIALYLADRHPEAGLAPAAATPARGQFYKWMVLITNSLQTQYRSIFYPHEFVSDPAGEESMKAATVARLSRSFAQIGAHLDGNRWLLGDSFSAADLYLFMMVRWGRNLAAPPRAIPSIARHAAAVAERAAVREALAFEGLTPPYI
jgi:glutathione S-transferase